MFAVYAESFSTESPLDGLAVGERPEPGGARRLDHGDRQGLRAQPPRPLVAARGGPEGRAAADDPRLRRRGLRRGRQRGRRPRRHQPARAGPATRPSTRGRSLLSERFQGTFADRVAVPRANVVPKPASLSFEEAACLPTAWLTAYRMLFVQGGCKPGDTVLVQGAGGGVATALIALARAGGPQGARDQPRRGQARQGARAGRPRGLRDRPAAARPRSTRSWRRSGGRPGCTRSGPCDPAGLS